jgi:hypothetical protein
LSFEYKPLFADYDPSIPLYDPFDPWSWGGENEESFSVSLLDPITRDPLLPYDADLGDPSETYYFMHDWDFYMGDDEIVTDTKYVTMTDLGGGWTDVTLDLTSLPTGTSALLTFDLLPGWYDYGLNSQIEIDNVTYIPAFSSVTLGLLGFGTLGVLRRRWGAGGK